MTSSVISECEHQVDAAHAELAELETAAFGEESIPREELEKLKLETRVIMLSDRVGCVHAGLAGMLESWRPENREPWGYD